MGKETFIQDSILWTGMEFSFIIPLHFQHILNQLEVEEETFPGRRRLTIRSKKEETTTPSSSRSFCSISSFFFNRIWIMKGKRFWRNDIFILLFPFSWSKR